MNTKFISLVLALSLSIASSLSLAKKKHEIVEWTNPTPTFSELNLDTQTLSDIIGKGQLIITHAPKDISFWTQGKLKDYQDVRFSSAMIVVDAPTQEVKKVVGKIENYGEFMPQIRKAKIIEEKEHHYLTSYIQQYNMGPFPLKSKFHWQYSHEDNGDLSFILHDGDVDGAIGRYEFIELPNDKTLLVLTTWQDLDTAKLTYRMMIKANADFKATMPAVAAAIVQLQLQNYFKSEQEDIFDESSLPTEPKIPLLTQDPDKLNTLIRLAENGTLVIIEDKQWYKDPQNDMKVSSIVFASAVRTMPVAPEVAKPLVLDLRSMKEFTKEIKKVTITDIENGKHVQAKMKIGLGVVGLSLKFHFDMVEKDDNVRLLLNGGGDMYPMLGAYEFSGFERDGKQHTFGVLTQGGGVSKDAPYMMKLIAKKLPQFDFIRTIFSTLPQIEKQQIWVMEQLEKSE